jgi:NAD(P)-dependent dehydrogenase (short-subunit alcohol dehydrogenase family)
MLLANKNAVIYGAAGATGSAVARAFAREGARVFVTGRDIGAVKSLATEIVAGGGVAEAATVDALDEGAIEDHLAGVVASAQQIDISYNAIGLPQTGLQGIPLIELPSDSFVLPLATYGRSHFLTARAAARRMTKQGCGVIMMHTPEPARFGAALVGGMGSPANSSKGSWRG